MGTPGQKAEARRMRDEGVTLADIANALGVSTSTIFRWTSWGAAERQREASRRWKDEYREEYRHKDREYRRKKRAAARRA